MEKEINLVDVYKQFFEEEEIADFLLKGHHRFEKWLKDVNNININDLPKEQVLTYLFSFINADKNYTGSYDTLIQNFEEKIFAGDISLDEFINRDFSEVYFIASNYNNRGYALRRLGHLDRALSDLQKAIELLPSYSNPYNGIGIIKRQKGEQGFNELLRSEYMLTPKPAYILGVFKASRPYLAKRLFQRIPPEDVVEGLGDISSYGAIFHETYESCKDIDIIIDYLEKTSPHELTSSFKAIIYFYMGNPLEVNKLLRDTKKDTEAFYYLIISCKEFLYNIDEYLIEALNLSYKTLQEGITNEDPKSLYYSGLIFYIDDKFDLSLKCFEKIKYKFLPAAYMCMFLYDKFEHFLKRDVLIEFIKKEEGEISIEFSFEENIERRQIDIKLSSSHIFHFAHYMEIAPAIKKYSELLKIMDGDESIGNPEHQKPLHEVIGLSDYSYQEYNRIQSLSIFNNYLSNFTNRLNKVEQKFEKEVISKDEIKAKRLIGDIIGNVFQANQLIGDSLFEWEFKATVQHVGIDEAILKYISIILYSYYEQKINKEDALLLSMYCLQRAHQERKKAEFVKESIAQFIEKSIEGLSAYLFASLGGFFAILSISIAIGGVVSLFNEIFDSNDEKVIPYSEFKEMFQIKIGEKLNKLGASKFNEIYPIFRLINFLDNTGYNKGYDDHTD